jgi:hypothetical protein
VHEEHRERHRPEDQPRDVGRADRPDAEDRERHQRFGGTSLPADEGREQNASRREETDRLGRSPAVVVRLRNREDQGEETAGDEHRAGRVEALGERVAALREQQRRQPKRREPDRDVDVEDPRPAEPVGQHAAEQDAGDSAEGADRAPHAERGVPLATLRERRHQDRQSGGRDDRRAEALERPGDDQCIVGPGQAGDERCDAEEDEAADEQATSPEKIGGTTAEQKEASEEQRVGADYPLEVLLGEAQVRLDRRQGDVHDRDVQDDHELHGGEQRERPPFPVG